MRTLITNVFGTYSAITDSSGTALEGLAGVDWPWLAGVLLFSICLYGLIGFIIRLFGGRK